MDGDGESPSEVARTTQSLRLTGPWGPGQTLDTQEPGYPSRRLSWFLSLNGTIYLKSSYECVRGIPTRGVYPRPVQPRSINPTTYRSSD